MTPYADISERRRVARQGMQRLREDPEYKAREAEAARIARENSRTMNAKIISAVESGKRYGDILRSGQPTPTDPGLAGRLDTLQRDCDTALNAGDEDALGFVEHRIDKLLNEARAARTEPGPR